MIILNKAKEFQSDFVEIRRTIHSNPEIGLGKIPASEDFAYIAREIPATFFMLSVGFPNETNYPMHHSKVAFEEDVLHKGAAMLATCAKEWLKEHK